MTPDERADEYRKLMGGEALERQQQLAKTHYPCCANKRTDGHHPLCRVQRRKLERA